MLTLLPSGIYANLNQSGTVVIGERIFTNSFSGDNLFWKPLVVNTIPVFNPLISGVSLNSYVISSGSVTKTWSLYQLSQTEIEDRDAISKKNSILLSLDDLKTGSGNNLQRIERIEKILFQVIKRLIRNNLLS